MKNKKLAAVAGLMAVALVGGSFAYFNQTMKVENPFDTGKYSSELVETFTPEDGENWQPGTKVDKAVNVKNTGDYPVVVRVRFDETWTRKEGSVKYFENETGLKGCYYEKAELKGTDGTGQIDPLDGLTEKDGAKDTSVVVKYIDDTNWVFNEKDGYYYYKGVVPAQVEDATGKKVAGETKDFLKSVRLLEDADMGHYTEIKYYTTDDEITEDTEWTTYTGEVPVLDGEAKVKHTKTVAVMDENAQGYSGSDYKLTITAQTVQATADAVKASFELTAAPAGTAWDFLAPATN